MNKKEAEKVIEILLKCDGGCEYCVADLIKLFCNSFLFQALFPKITSTSFTSQRGSILSLISSLILLAN